MEELRRAEVTDAHLEARTQRIGRIAVKDPVFVDLLCHSAIVEVWRQFLGPDVLCSTRTANILYPGHESTHWHADYPYWALEAPWPTGRLTGQTIWMLDDFTEENGATGIVPGSHRRSRAPDNPKEWHVDGLVVTGEAGSAVLLDGAMWHTARPNRTQEPRVALLGMYIRPCCVPMEDMRGQLQELEDPSDLVVQMMGGNQRQPVDVTG